MVAPLDKFPPTDAPRTSLRDSKAARWTALMIVSFTMLCGYFVADVASPLELAIEKRLSWTSADYGFYTGAYAWFNVFLGMLVLGGIILDRKGARFAGTLGGVLMVAGAALNGWGFKSTGIGTSGGVWVASLGYATFGMGLELCGITASKIVARWFKDREMALAMGLQVSTARIGTAMALGLALPFANRFGSVSAPVILGTVLLGVGLIAFLFYCAMDSKLDASEGGDSSVPNEDEAFRLSDIGDILRIRGFWYIAILCALFYAAVFPFLKYATGLMMQKYGVSEGFAGAIPSILPFAAIPLTVVFGAYYDRRGKGASMMILGSILLVAVHAVFTAPGLNHWIVALLATVVLGFAFALVPSAMWPSVPRFVPQRQLGTAFALIFFIQNLVALFGVPYLIGVVLNRFCVVGTTEDGASKIYDYTLPMALFAAISVLSVLFAFLLKAEDKRMGYGLELPSQKQ